MKFKEDRPFPTPEAAERKLLELANAMEADHAGRLAVEIINRQFERPVAATKNMAWRLKPPSRTAGSRCIRPEVISPSRRPGRNCSRKSAVHGVYIVAPTDAREERKAKRT
jgi:hypothetical protein